MVTTMSVLGHPVVRSSSWICKDACLMVVLVRFIRDDLRNTADDKDITHLEGPDDAFLEPHHSSVKMSCCEPPSESVEPWRLLAVGTRTRHRRCRAHPTTSTSCVRSDGKSGWRVKWSTLLSRVVGSWNGGAYRVLYSLKVITPSSSLSARSKKKSTSELSA